MSEQRLLLLSSVAFLVVNATENIVHYSIGRREGRLRLPNALDAFRIIVVMAIFAILQGVVITILSRFV